MRTPLFKAPTHHELCQTFLEAGARVNVWETTGGTKSLLSEYTSVLGEEVVRRLYTGQPHELSIRDTALSPLHLANLIGEEKIVRLLLRHGADPNMHAGALGTPLHYTLNENVVELLIAYGADVNVRNELGYTPLYNAISRCDIFVTTTLAQAGVDVDLLYDVDMTLLDIAIERNFADIIVTLAEARCDLNGHPGGIPPLHRAAANANDEIIKLLISEGAETVIRHEGRTVLHVADNELTVSRLIAYGADINAKDETGSTPLTLAAEKHHLQLMEVYLMAEAEVSLTHLRENNILEWIVHDGLYHVLRLLVSRCDLRQAMNEDENLLRTAIARHHEAIANLLIREFPDLVVKDGYNGYENLEAAALFSSLDLQKKVEAERKDLWDIVLFLSNTDREDSMRMLMNALIQLARLGHHVNFPLMVLAAGSDENLDKLEDAITMHSTRWMSDSELFVKPTYEHIETNCSMLQIFLDNGADVSEAAWEEMGILHVAAWRNDERLMRTLLEAGANLFCKDASGHTPSYWAAQIRTCLLDYPVI